ncbi:MAG: aminotransferase class V-fold PLP-dependent enzyme, partial [Leptolyngbya sp. SIO4C1]|nr:aminotransferase class V-fold PLP-dependent enzyme [Leptolyngbya sp. SIO4C1]
MPQPALETIAQAHQHLQSAGPFSSAANQWLQDESQLLRQRMATALGASPESLTLTEDVTVGCNIPLWGLPWQAGDRILLSDCEHPGIFAAARELSRRYDLAVDVFSLLRSPDDPAASLAQALQPRTRLVILSHILWNTGQLLPLKAMVYLCHSQSVPVLIDAAQSVGMLPLTLDQLGADFYAFTGHKWWC